MMAAAKGYGPTTQCNVRYPDAIVDATDLLVDLRIYKSRSEFFVWCARAELFRFGLLPLNPNKQLPEFLAEEQREIFDEIKKKLGEVGELIKRGENNNLKK